MQEDELVLEEHPDFVDIGSRVTWTTTFGYILNTALTRMGGGDPAAGDHMEVHLQMLELLSKVRGGPDPTAYTERQLRWEIVDRERWLNSFIPAPITDLKLVKWRHWKPSRIKELGPINQKGPLEEEMGGTPPGTSNPPCWGDRPPCPSPGRQ